MIEPRIGTSEWINQKRGKFGVIRLQFGWYPIDNSGLILRRDGKNARFPTHAGAITFAHREATEAIATKNQLPPLTQEPTC